MIREIIKSRGVNAFLRGFFGLAYGRDHLRGYYFQNKIMGWMWAWRSLPNKLFGENKSVPWPVHPRTIVSGSENIHFDDTSLNVFQTPGCYWQAFDGSITIGHNCYVAPNVGVITTNHDIKDPSRHLAGKDVCISDNCWIGMNAMVLPGVTLGPGTVVAAGAVVSRSFPEGMCVVGGVPAKVIKRISLDDGNE